MSSLSIYGHYTLTDGQQRPWNGERNGQRQNGRRRSAISQCRAIMQPRPHLLSITWITTTSDPTPGPKTSRRSPSSPPLVFLSAVRCQGHHHHTRQATTVRPRTTNASSPHRIVDTSCFPPPLRPTAEKNVVLPHQQRHTLLLPAMYTHAPARGEMPLLSHPPRHVRLASTPSPRGLTGRGTPRTPRERPPGCRRTRRLRLF
ncbi:hypothetical protein F5X68DRAFT_39060 [Plectosphaerella plurivora]|uniref:Uncharacterized protein n=1 Tax=Plectosphaerella plurivora TaxID=936078 RepID=A0A9P8V548_9PEZI|nr:hypothetical protein F5X68DRAFT_39060 [Plectosphaerella plurivora]